MGIDDIRNALRMLSNIDKGREFLNMINDLKELSNDPNYQNALRAAESACKAIPSMMSSMCEKEIKKVKDHLKVFEERMKMYDTNDCKEKTASECIYDKYEKKQREKGNIISPILDGSDYLKSSQTNQEKLANLSLDELRQKHLEQMKNLYMQEEISNKL